MSIKVFHAFSSSSQLPQRLFQILTFSRRLPRPCEIHSTKLSSLKIGLPQSKKNIPKQLGRYIDSISNVVESHVDANFTRHQGRSPTNNLGSSHHHPFPSRHHALPRIVCHGRFLTHSPTYPPEIVDLRLINKVVSAATSYV